MEQKNRNQPIPYDRKLTLALQLPDLPPEEWSDFRRDYECSKDITLKEIAKKYHCDPRTVRKHLLLNKGSTDLGRQLHPTKLAPFLKTVDRMYDAFSNESGEAYGICQISHLITEQIREAGYEGSERSVRNYLRNKFYILKERTTT